MSGEQAVWLADGIGMIDLKFRGMDSLIASYLLDTSDGLLIIETGPANALEHLLNGVRHLGRNPEDIRHIAVTHIHLDHAAGAGVMLEMFPEATFYVHQRGARHMIDPSRLLDSAQRIYGDQMVPLWGEMKPVPAERVVTLDDGDTLTCGDLSLDVLYTPGHASHHVSFADTARKLIFAGDVAGVRIPPSPMVWPPTPPPDIDVEAWHVSIQRLRDRQPERLLLTHYGPIDDVTEHLDQLETRLDRWVSVVSPLYHAGTPRDEIVSHLEADAISEMVEAGEPTDTDGTVTNVTPFGMAVDGLSRYLQKKSS